MVTVTSRRIAAMDRRPRAATIACKALGRQLLGRNIVPHVGSRDRVRDKLADPLAEVALGSRDLLVPVQLTRWHPRGDPTELAR